MIDYIECRSIYGGVRQIPREKLVFRPSVYGVIVHQGKILLLNSRSANLLALPGGGIDIGEPLEQALKREVREETGIDVKMARFLHFEEDFFYYDPKELAFHSFLFIFECTPLTFELASDDEVDDEDAEKPRWYNIGGLNKTDFLSFGKFIMDYLNQIELEER